jgi:hypothetical protein
VKHRLILLLLPALLVPAAPLPANDVFFEDFSTGYEHGRLVGQNGWEEFANTPNSPVVVDTEGRRHADFGWAVAASRPGSADYWAQKAIPAPESENPGSVVIEIVVCPFIHPQGAKSSIMFGYGVKLMDKGIGMSDKGVFFRDGWGHTDWAIDHHGEMWNDYDSQDVVSLRSVWNLLENTVSLAIKNHTRDEADFTPLFFDREQKQSTVGLGVWAPLDEWQRVCIRVNGARGSMLFQARISTE